MFCPGTYVFQVSAARLEGPTFKGSEVNKDLQKQQLLYWNIEENGEPESRSDSDELRRVVESKHNL
jgi:hypothetical protein